MDDRYVTVEDAGNQTRRDLEDLIDNVRDTLQTTEDTLLETQRGVPVAAEDYDSAVCTCLYVCVHVCE